MFYFPSTHSVPPVLQHIDGSTGIRTVLGRNTGENLVLSAKILQASPPVTSEQISWRKGDTSIDNTGGYVITANAMSSQTNLTITRVDMANTGLYTVTVMHEAANVSLQFRLEVFSKLYFIFNLAISLVPSMYTLKCWEGPGMRLSSSIAWTLNFGSHHSQWLPYYGVSIDDLFGTALTSSMNRNP
jgi:hypothetical protein